MSGIVRPALWLGFFGIILVAWWMMYAMATDMGLDLIGRPNQMARTMAAMDPHLDMDMPMARFGPLFGMWAAMMAAMMLPTMVPTLRTYDALITAADGTRAGWLGVLLGYFMAWVAFAAVITGVQLALLFGGVVDVLGSARAPLVCRRITGRGWPVSVHPRERNLPRGLPFADGLFPWPLAHRIRGRDAHGPWPGRVLHCLLLGGHGTWLCRRNDELALDGPCHSLYGVGKTAADRASDPQAAWRCTNPCRIGRCRGTNCDSITGERTCV